MTGWFDRVNPVTKLAASGILAILLILSLDVVSAGVALALEMLLLPLTGIGWRRFWRRTWPVWLAAPLTAVTIALYGEASGEVYLRWAIVQVSDGSLQLAAATLLRVLAIALPSVVLFVGVDPTDLADGLGQLVRLPARFVMGGLAGVRMIGLFVQDWRALELARRARGVADRGRIRRLAGMAFALLVLSVRRGSKLATAMEARGFGSDTPRSWARPSALGWRDAVLLLVITLIGVIAVSAAVAAGSWELIFQG